MLGKIIKENRKLKGYSQEELGKILNFSQDNISLWELGKSYPDYKTLRKLCILLNISGDEILQIENEKQIKDIKKEINNNTN